MEINVGKTYKTWGGVEYSIVWNIRDWQGREIYFGQNKDGKILIFDSNGRWNEKIQWRDLMMEVNNA